MTANQPRRGFFGRVFGRAPAPPPMIPLNAGLVAKINTQSKAAINAIGAGNVPGATTAWNKLKNTVFNAAKPPVVTSSIASQAEAAVTKQMEIAKLDAALTNFVEKLALGVATANNRVSLKNLNRLNTINRNNVGGPMTRNNKEALANARLKRNIIRSMTNNNLSSKQVQIDTAKLIKSILVVRGKAAENVQRLMANIERQSPIGAKYANSLTTWVAARSAQNIQPPRA